MRAIWDGSISFGLVNIPINLFSCLKGKPFRFHFLHHEDQGRIRNQMVCEVCGRIVDYKRIVRGYEYEKGKTIALTNKDLTAVRAESTRNIAITDFVSQKEIDPSFCDKPYYLAPGRHGERAYSLLCRVLAHTQQVGLGKLVLHAREHLAAIRAYEEVLMLELLHFSDELRKPEALGLPANKYKPTKREFDLAQQLISQLSTNFDPEKYQDTYQDALLGLVKQS
jgi:DNA end-binding protein Ku